ncbi:MAG: GntR family transcriptional regulator [Rhodomicrobium sp.]
MSESQAERLCSIIEEEILSLKFKPGDKLDETRLAERYGTSRTPVREAIRKLSANGLIELRPHKGAVVAKLGIRELVELLEVMAELEGACGRLAAKACLKGDLDAINEGLALCRHHSTNNDVQGYKLANETFHEAIYRASRNNCLINLTRSTRKRVAAYRRIQLEQVNRIRTSTKDHERIARAICEEHPEEADRLLQIHILNIGAELRRLISMVTSNALVSLSATEPSSLDGLGCIEVTLAE